MLIDGNLDIVRNLDGKLLETIADHLAFVLVILRVIGCDHHVDLGAAMLFGVLINPFTTSDTKETLAFRKSFPIELHKLIQFPHTRTSLNPVIC